MIIKCLNCEKETKNPKFCSRSCSCSYSNKLSPKRKLTRICTKCDLIVCSYRSVFCKLHHEENKYNKAEIESRTLSFYHNKACLEKMHPSSKNAHIRGLARSQHKKLAKTPCFNCGYSLHVELCHIKAVTDFDEYATVAEVNHISNIVQLCRNCHWEFDNGLLTINRDAET